ncbi:MAG: M20 family metallopeptidase [Lachnospiraceae bacterium]|nr:M20 family metallopeptidase [Lachnospiraceae bacterium]
MDRVKQEILQAAEQEKEQLIAWRRYLHSHAETGFDLPGTLAYVKGELAAMGITAKPCGKSGLVAELGKKNSDTVFLLRADMDGLPISEESGEAFVASNGNMHACGHDMHTAMLLGAAKLLKEREQTLSGTVRLMFQPAEELLSGSKDMIEAGVLQNPPVSAAMMIHVMTGTMFSTGTAIVSSPGVSAPAADYFTIRIKGKGCHGSSPNLGVDPVNVAAHMILAIQGVQTRELSMGERATLTVGSIKGGEAANAIPDQVELKGTMRSYSEETREYLKKRLQEIAKQTAAVFLAEAEVEFPCGCPALQNDASVSKDVLGYAKELLGDEKAFSTQELTGGKAQGRGEKTAGSEDFSYISEKVPSVMVALAAGAAEQGYCYPLHHPSVRFDEAALPVGSALFAYSACRFLA